MIVHLTDQAEADLENIGDYIAGDNPNRAVSFVRELRVSCEGPAHMPFCFPLLDRYKKTGVRRRVHGNYLIFYIVPAERIEIIHILHGAMDYERILFPEG